jgi:hypothetical protein
VGFNIFRNKKFVKNNMKKSRKILWKESVRDVAIWRTLSSDEQKNILTNIADELSKVMGKKWTVSDDHLIYDPLKLGFVFVSGGWLRMGFSRQGDPKPNEETLGLAVGKKFKFYRTKSQKRERIAVKALCKLIEKLKNEGR